MAEETTTFEFTIESENGNERTITFEPNPPSIYWRNQFIMLITRFFGVPKAADTAQLELDVDYEDVNTLPPKQLKKLLKVCVNDTDLQVRNLDLEGNSANQMQALSAIRFFFTDLVQTQNDLEQ